MRKGLAWALALALTAMVPGFAAAGGPPIRVGNLPAVTGSGATWGICHRDSSILAVEEFNAQGGVDGRKVEFFWYDTKGTWDAVHAQAAELDELINEFNEETGLLKAL